MKKYLFVLACTVLISTAIKAQVNVSYVGNITYNQDLSDIWGYAAPDGSEYAIVGVRNGVSVVDLSDPSNPAELFFFNGASSSWRDIKTWDGYAYVTNETGNGLMVIDLTGLPDNASAYDWEPNIPGLGTLGSIHNIFIDEFGYAYLVGSNLNSGGALYVDVATTPGTPIFTGAGPAIYAHDIYVRDNIAYNSEIYAGIFSIYDVSNKNNTVLLGSNPTDASFTHNAWLSDDGTILYTTDEVAGAPVGSYDVSDPSDVQELDQFRPYETLGDGVIPHNVHVWQDWLIVSYYTDGCILVDGSNPTNLVEVGNFDTFLPPSTGFSGAWGAYPFLPSGLILISDIGNGMYVLQPNYVNACWLEGTVTDANTAAGLAGVSIVIETTNVNDLSVAQGNFATGYAVSGLYNVTFSKAGYQSLTTEVELINGEVTILNVELVPFSSFVVSGQVFGGAGSNTLEGATVILQSEDFTFEFTSGADGGFNIENVFPDSYEVSAGKWGWISECLEVELDEVNNSFNITLMPGLQDDFSVDLGWTTSSTASSGDWERDEPNGTTFNGAFFNPDTDVEGDCFEYAFVTGNGGGQAGNDDVDGGVVTLTSPLFEYDPGNTMVSYYRWFANAGGDNNPNDELEVHLTNGAEEVLLETLDDSDNLNFWEEITHDLSGLGLSGDMYSIRFRTSDGAGSGHLVEAAVDQFAVHYVTGIEEQQLNADISVMPNPFADYFELRYDVQGAESTGVVRVYDELSRLVVEQAVKGPLGVVQLGEILNSGIYLLQLQFGDEVSVSERLVKY